MYESGGGGGGADEPVTKAQRQGVLFPHDGYCERTTEAHTTGRGERPASRRCCRTQAWNQPPGPALHHQQLNAVPILRASRPPFLSFAELLGHSLTAPSVECAELLKLGPAQVVEQRKRLGAFQLQIANLEFGTDPGLNVPNTPQVAALSRLLTSSQLHSLHWRNEPRTLQFLDIPWGHLTVIDLVPVWSPMCQVLLILRKAPKLRSLSIFITEACDVAAPVVLSDLVVLWIGTEVDVGPLFKRFTLPSLLNINVFCMGLVPPIPQIAVLDCIARSGSLLHTTIFKSLRIFNSDLITFLRLTPSLLLFEISNDGEATITDDILHLLTAGETPCLCPNLRTIRFLESSVSSADGLLADMVESRRTNIGIAFPTVLLSRLVLHFSETDLQRHTEDIRRIKNLECADFRVWINEIETA
ncbi:hypothetical protein B0H19DRAFT_1367327 [Mycena capillaripes]|nr:hypothetical protein B0H19DRAFT_1367327 [Mycena capillaripes]